MDFETGPVIAAVRGEKHFNEALTSGVEVIFDLTPNVLDIAEKVKCAHENGKKLFIHIDLAEGIGKDRAGIEFAKKNGIDGILSTRTNIIKIAAELELLTVQRFFLIDSHSVDTTVETLKNSRADMIEIMPGVVPKIINKLQDRINQPIIAGGLIEYKAEIVEAIKNGAAAISTGKQEFWEE